MNPDKCGITAFDRHNDLVFAFLTGAPVAEGVAVAASVRQVALAHVGVQCLIVVPPRASIRDAASVVLHALACERPVCRARAGICEPF